MNEIITGDCLTTFKTMSHESVDLLVTDPPYGYSFMGKDWDKAVPSVEIWQECLRVLKPGAFAFVMSAPRQDVLSQMIVRLGVAGFDTSFTSLYHSYASGFPKAMNMGKKTGKPELQGSYAGLQPKPAVEVIIVAMKPLSEKSYVDQALANGKGITWLDDCRIPYQNEDDRSQTADKANKDIDSYKNIPEQVYGKARHEYIGEFGNPQGRFPANLLVSDDVLNDGKITKSTGGKGEASKNSKTSLYSGYASRDNSALGGYGDSGSYSRYFDLDKWAEKTLPFLIVPKASKSEKDKGLENEPDKFLATMGDGIGARPHNPEQKTAWVKNNHPTVKPLRLMSYLITMGSRANDLVLDPFCGSGTTCLAAKQLGRQYLGIELSEEYATIARKRLDTVSSLMSFSG